MAKGFNLTAEINLRGPSNIGNVIADIRRQLGTIDTAVTVKIDPQAANNANKLTAVLTRLNTALTETGTQSALTARNISQLATSLGSFQTTATAASRSLSGLPRNITQTTQSMQSVAKQTATARTEIEEFGRQSALAVRRFTAFSAATAPIYGLINAIGKATKEFIEFDRQIVRLTQITGSSYEELGDLTRTVTSLSTSLGVASSDLIGVADTLAQAGLSAKETEQALKALALTAVAPSFDKLSDTVEGAIALMRQFSISTADLEKALSSINSVAAKFAVESSDIITAIQRTGGVFSAASRGVSEGTDALNEFIAVFTSVRATTRESAETIATGLRTIFTRIQRADTIEALKDYGVTLTDVEGKFVGAYRAVELLAQGLGKLDPRDLKFSQIVEELGGFRQIGKVLPLIQQFGTAQDALKTAYAGQGSLATDAAKAQAALATQFNKTRQEFVALIRDVGNSDSFKSLVSVGLTLANTFIKVADIAKPLLPILTSIAAVKGSEALFQFGSGFLGGFRGNRSAPSAGQAQASSQALNTARNQQNSTAAINNTRALGTNTSALQSLTSVVQQLNSTIVNNRRAGPQSINKGGVVRAFARGGVVPGTGNSDTVPAMLQPGEFVIRKKAVETIGANNLHAMNKYGIGGGVQGFAKGGNVTSSSKEKIRGYIDGGIIKEKIGKLPSRSKIKYNQIPYFTDIDAAGEVETRIIPYPVKMDRQDFPGLIEYIRDEFRQNKSQFIKFRDEGAIGPEGETPEFIYGGRKSLPIKDNTISQPYVSLPPPRSADWAKGRAFERYLGDKYPIATRSSRTNVTDSSTFDDIILDHFAPLDFDTGDAKFEKGVKKYFSKTNKESKVILSKRFRSDQERLPWTPGVDSFINNKALSDTTVFYPDNPEKIKTDFDNFYAEQYKLALQSSSQTLEALKQSGLTGAYAGGKIQKFMAGGVAEAREAMTLEEAKKKSRKEIIQLLSGRPGGISTTEKEVKVGTGQVYKILGERNPDSSTQALKEAILKEYVKTYNRRAGASQGQITRMTNQGLVVAAAGMFGNKFADTTETIKSPLLSSPAQVRIMSGVLGAKTAASLESVFAEATEQTTDKGAETLLISDILERFGLGRELNLDFDRTLAIGADEILSDPGTPVFSEFSDRTKVGEALKKARLTALGEALASSVRDRPELIGLTKIVTARPESTLDLVQGWLSSQGLPIPLSQFKGFGGAGVKADDIANLKAAFLSPGSLFVDDDPRNISAASLRKDVTSYQYGIGKSLSNNQAEGDLQGLLLEQVIQKLGGPGASKGFGFDFPTGLGAAAKYFDLPDDIPTDVKRTINGPSTITDNIVTYLKNVMGYASGGIVRKFAVGGLADATSEMQSLMTGLYGNRQAKKTDSKADNKQKNFGKIALRDEGRAISATYFKNDDRSGSVSAYKMRDYLYYVGLSEATGGYGPRLYDVVMEAATANGAMLTSDRNSVSGAAKRVWEYYFNNRSDVKKTPLKPDDWTRNQANIDPKLYGKPETWPPANDPAWILQSGYSKSPSLINDRNSVVRMDQPTDSRSMALGFFQSKSFAKGGRAQSQDKYIEQYKKILSSILPPEMLSKEGMLRKPDGGSESIDIISPKPETLLQKLGLAQPESGNAYYAGGLEYKVLRHLFNKRKDLLDPNEADTLDKFISQNLSFLGDNDEISLLGGKHKGVLAHETFHDIQGFLYDNYPEIIDKLTDALSSEKVNIEDWYKDPANKKFTGEGNYQFKHLFPSSEEDSPYGPKLQLEARETLNRRKRLGKIPSTYTSPGFYKLLEEAQMQLGRNETIPVLLGAASEGNEQAATIVSRLFTQSGLNSDFMSKLPKFLTGGSVEKLSDGGTVPALVSNGEAYVPPALAKRIGYGKLNKMNQADKVGGVRSFSSGGDISVFKGPGSGTSDSIGPVSLPVGSFVIRAAATKTLGLHTGGTVRAQKIGIQKFNVGGNVASDSQLTAISDEMSKALKALPDSIRDVVREFNIQTTQLALGDTFDKINLKLRQQLLIAQEDISNLGPDFVEGVRGVLGAGIRKLENIELDTIRSSPAYKGPGREYYDDVEKARAGRKVFESGASDAKDLMQAMARSVAGVGGEQYPKPLVSVSKMRPEDYYSRLDYSDIGPSMGVNDRGKLYAQALAGEDPIKVNALIEKLRKEMEDAAKAAGIAISKWGKSESWAVWDVGKQLRMQQNPSESSDKYYLGNPLDDARVQKEIVQRHLGWESTGGRDLATGERLSSADLRDLGASIMAQTEATKAQTEATKKQTVSSDGQQLLPFMTRSANVNGVVGPGGQRMFPFMGGTGGPDQAVLPSGINYNPTIRNIRRNTRQNDPDIQERYRNLVSNKLNTGLERVANRAAGFGAALALPLEGLSRLAGATTVTGKVFGSLSTSAGQLSSTFYNSISAIRGFINFVESDLGKRWLGSLSQSFNSININKLLESRFKFTGGAKLGEFGIGIAAGATAAVAITKAFIDYSNAIKQSKIEEAQKKQEEALIKSAEALEKYSKTQDRASLNLANTLATAAASAALSEADASRVGDRKFGVNTSLAVAGGAASGAGAAVAIGALLGTSIGPIGTAIGAAAGGAIAGIIAQMSGADRAPGTTAEESAKLLSTSRARLSEVYSERFSTGDTSEDIMSSPEWNAQRELLARSNAQLESFIRSIEAETSISSEIRQQRIQETLQIEASAQLREEEQNWLKQKGLLDLDNATKAYTRSLKNMFANMDDAISRSVFILDNFNTSLELAEASVKGQAKIGVFKSDTADIIKNSRTASPEDLASAANAAGSFFGSENQTISSLLNVGPRIESAVLAAIQSAQTLPTSTTDEAVGAAIKRSVRDELSGSSLPQELSDKLGQQIAIEIEKRRKSGDDRVDFRELEEAIPGLKDSIEALKGAQDIAIKALENYAQKIGVLIEKTNVSVDLLIQAGEYNRKASETRFNGQLQLDRTFGNGPNFASTENFRNNSIRNQTGGANSAAGILNNINRLETRRNFQQGQLGAAQERGKSGARDVLAFTDQISRTTRSLRDNQKALEDLATNSELASIALEKISEAQARNQAGQNIIEKYVTSTREDNFKLSAAFERLDNNMQGLLNDPFGSRNVRDSMFESDNPMLAADQASAQDRRDTLEAFNMIAPFLGDSRQQNNIKANVLESMLRETGIGLTPMFNDVLKALRNPENDGEMSQLVEQYKKSIEIQSRANEALGELNANLANSIKVGSAEAFKLAIESTFLEFEKAQTGHLAKIEEILSKQPRSDAATMSTGGVVYRNIGGSIFKPKGTDTVPAMLTPGEFVVNRASAQKYGSVLNTINNNTYSSGGKVRYYDKGGFVSPLLRNEQSFTAAASEKEIKDFDLADDYYQSGADKTFSKNKHFDPAQLIELLDLENSVKLISLTNSPSIVPIQLAPVGLESYPLASSFTSDRVNKDIEQFKKFISRGVSTSAVGVGFYPDYEFDASFGILNGRLEKPVQYKEEIGTIPEGLFKSVGTLRKRYLNEKDTENLKKVISTIDFIKKNMIDNVTNSKIYNRQKYISTLSGKADTWKSNGTEVSDLGNNKVGLATNKLGYDKVFGKNAMFLTKTGTDIPPIDTRPISKFDSSGFSVNNKEMGIKSTYTDTGFTVDTRYQYGGDSVPPHISVLPEENVYKTNKPNIDENLDFLKSIATDISIADEDFKNMGTDTIYSEQYKIYNESLSKLWNGLIEKVKFNKNILNETKIADLNSLDPDNKKIDYSKFKELYVWSNQAVQADKNKIRDKNKKNIGIDFPISEDLGAGKIGDSRNFVWSLSPTIRAAKGAAGSDYDGFLNNLDYTKYKVMKTFSSSFDAPWAVDKKIDVEFPYQILKKLPIYDEIERNITQEYDGYGLDSTTFKSPWSNDSINPLKISDDYGDNILLASPGKDIDNIFEQSIRAWINSNKGNIPTKSLNLGNLTRLFNLSEKDILPQIGSGTNDLENEKIESTLDILGSKTKFSILAANRVLYKKDDDFAFKDLDLDSESISGYKDRRALLDTFGSESRASVFPNYTDVPRVIKGEAIKSKYSLLQDFINKSSIQDMTLKELAPWTKNIKDATVSSLFDNGIQVPDNLRKVYTQTLAWTQTRSKGMADLMNQTEAKYPGKFQELMSLLQLAFYVNGGKTPSGKQKLSSEFNSLQQGYFGSQNLDDLSVVEDSRVAGKKGKQWWKDQGPNWLGFADYNLNIIKRKQEVSAAQSILNKAKDSFSDQDAADLASDIQYMVPGDTGLGITRNEDPLQAGDIQGLIFKLLNTNRVYTEGYRLSLADTIQNLSIAGGKPNDPDLDNIKKLLHPDSDLVNYLSFKDAILVKPLSDVEGIRVEGEDRDIKAPRLASYVFQNNDLINGSNPWRMYERYSEAAVFNDMISSFDKIVRIIGAGKQEALALKLQNPSTIYSGPVNTFDGKVYEQPNHKGADPILGEGTYPRSYRALAGTNYDNLFEKSKDGEKILEDSTKDNKDVVYRSRGGAISYRAGGGSIVNFQPKGTDTVPAMLTPGEFVINREATQRNLPLLQAMNSGGSVIYRANGSTKPEKSKSKYWWREPSIVGNNTEEAAKLYWSIVGGSSSTTPANITIYNRDNPGRPKKADGAFWSAKDLQKWYDYVNSAMASNYALQQAQKNEAMQRYSDSSARAISDNQKASEQSKNSWFYKEGRTWMDYLGIPESLSELETVIYGATSKILPAVLGAAGGGIGFAVGAPLGPGAIVPGVVLGTSGAKLGEYLNDNIYNLLPSSFKERIEQKIQAHPENYQSGKWVGFGAEIAAGAAYAPVVDKFFREQIGRKLTANTATQVLGAKYLEEVSKEEIRAAIRKIEQEIAEVSKNNSSKVLVHGGGSGKILPAGTKALAAETPVNTAFNSSYSGLGQPDTGIPGVTSRAAGAVTMGGFNMGLNSVEDTLRYAIDARQVVIKALQARSPKHSLQSLDNFGVLLGDITADSIRKFGKDFNNIPSMFLDNTVVGLMENAAASNPQAYSALLKRLQDTGDIKLYEGILQSRNDTWADVLNKIRDARFADTSLARETAEKQFQDYMSSAGIFGTKAPVQLIRGSDGTVSLTGESLGLYTTQFFNEFRSRNLRDLTSIDANIKAAWQRITDRFSSTEGAADTLKDIAGYNAGELSWEAAFGEKEKGPAYKNRGGLVYASEGRYIDFQPKGTDTVPAMLTPGEFVVNAKATRQNLDLLHDINQGTQYKADGGIIKELSGLYQNRIKSKEKLAAASNQWFIVPVGANKTSDILFDKDGLEVSSSEIMVTPIQNLARLYGLSSEKANKEVKAKYDWFDDKQHRIIPSKEIFKQQKETFNNQDPALKIIDELAFEYKNMGNLFETKNNLAFSDEAIDPETLYSHLRGKKGNYITDKVKSAGFMLKNRLNLLSALWKNLDEAINIVDSYINKNGLDKTIRSAFDGMDPGQILSIQQNAVGAEVENIDKMINNNDNIKKYADKIPNRLDESRILNFKSTRSLQNIIDYFGKQKGSPSESEDKPVKPAMAARGGLIYASAGQLINFQPRGTDTVPAMLTPGEFVINKAATQKNLPLLKQINSQTYQKGGVVQYYQQGSDNVVKPSGGSIGGMYSLSLDEKAISSIREFTSKFAEFSRNLANLTLPSIKIDETSLTSLNDFTKRFDNFTQELLKLNIPPVITVTGKHEVNVNINGASVFSSMDKYVSNIVKNEINNAFAQLARETDGAIAINYNPSVYSNQNDRNLA